MADRISSLPESPSSLTELVGGIVGDLQTLVRQELRLAKAEFQQEWDKTKTAAGTMVAGATLLTVAGLLLSFMVVYLLNALAPQLPLWGCYAIVGAVLALLGGVLVGVGRTQAADVNVIPPITAETMQENVQWLKNTPS
jgi:uncharacterized membrane protein YqjE